MRVKSSAFIFSSAGIFFCRVKSNSISLCTKISTARNNYKILISLKHQFLDVQRQLHVNGSLHLISVF